MNLRLSIVTPSYNQGRFIERTIKSVLDQDYKPSEYFVFDGGSQDETVSILEKYDEHIDWSSEPDKGQTDAVNKGLKKATGDVIGWLNSDDIYYPGCFKAVMCVFEQNPDVEVVYGNAYHIDEQDHDFESYYTEDWNVERLKENCFICQPTVFFRKSVVERFGLLDESLNFCMDYEYWLRLALVGLKFKRLDQYLAGSRLYEENKTLGERVKVHAEINDMLKKKLGAVPERWLSNYAHVMVDTNTTIKRESIIFPFVLPWYLLRASWRWERDIYKITSRVSGVILHGIHRIRQKLRA